MIRGTIFAITRKAKTFLVIALSAQRIILFITLTCRINNIGVGNHELSMISKLNRLNLDYFVVSVHFN